MKFPGERLQKFFRLSPRERVFLIEAWCGLFGIDLALRCLPFPRVASFCGRPRAIKTDGNAPSHPPAARLAWLVAVAGEHNPLGTTCLKEALVLSWLMSRRGMAATLRIGVARRHGSLNAHAWLEHDGRIILGGADAAAYGPLAPLTGESMHP